MEEITCNSNGLTGKGAANITRFPIRTAVVIPVNDGIILALTNKADIRLRYRNFLFVQAIFYKNNNSFGISSWYRVDRSLDRCKITGSILSYNNFLCRLGSYFFRISAFTTAI